MEFWSKLQEAAVFVPLWTIFFLLLRPVLLSIFKFIIRNQLQYPSLLKKKKTLLQNTKNSKLKSQEENHDDQEPLTIDYTTIIHTDNKNNERKLPLKLIEKQEKCVEQLYLFFFHTVSLTTGMILLSKTQYAHVLDAFTPTLNFKRALYAIFPILWSDYPHQHIQDESFSYRMFYCATAGIWIHHLVILLRMMAFPTTKTSASTTSAHQQSSKMSSSLLDNTDNSKNNDSNNITFQEAQRQHSAKKKRNEQYRLLLHHVVTVFLVLSSFSMNFIRIGHIFMILMDVSDILLSLAKALKYLGKESLVTPIFAAFTLSWLYTRVYCFGILFLSVILHPLPIMKQHVFAPFGNPADYFCTGAWVFYVVLLGLLYGVTLFWTILIIKVFETTLEQKGQSVDDVRSD